MSQYTNKNNVIFMMESFVKYIKDFYKDTVIFDLESSLYYVYGKGLPSDIIHLVTADDCNLNKIIFDWRDKYWKPTIKIEMNKISATSTEAKVSYNNNVFTVNLKRESNIADKIIQVDILHTYSPNNIAKHFLISDVSIVSLNSMSILKANFYEDIQPEVFREYYTSKIEMKSVLDLFVDYKHIKATHMLADFIRSSLEYIAK